MPADFVVQVRFTQFFNEDGVSTAQQVTILFLHFTQNTNAKARSGTGDGTACRTAGPAPDQSYALRL